jgi:cytochrome o ubiquinol oxidase subunit 2
MIKKINFMSLFIVGCTLLILTGCNMPILNPKGIIALQERNLIFTAIGLMLIVVIPVFIMTFWFAFKYRESNKNATYDPNFTHSTKLEIIWWGVPIIIIVILATITWKTTHELDPYKPLDSNVAPEQVQVIALDWKWLFIYPERGIATVNFLEIPVNTPINFKITADAPMNSIWIPQLSGQIYAMTGMQTKLHILANEEGIYDGHGASFTGDGFSGMNFKVKVVNRATYNAWINEVKQSPNTLTATVYSKLAQQSENNPVTYYGSVRKSLFDDVMMSYMMPNMKMSDEE